MKKQLKLFSLLAVIIVGMFAFTSSLLFNSASATYVEGNIGQDTVWTLTDSPFILIKNVTIQPGFTLTIEPGVEVRFGGNFTFIVEGRLAAVGTQEKMITFTSNKLQPQAGDWTTIKFINKTQSSTMEYVNVEYATDGITIKDGNVQIKNSLVRNNLQSGVYITGNNIASVRETTVELNKDGILISGNSSTLTIEQNVISANNESGINLQAADGTYVNDVAILDNTLASNRKGITVSGQVSTNITRNSISFNGIGVFYENATGILPIQFNDVYGNTCGMNTSVSDSVNAEYNYWGDPTGPYHLSLNPEGKGNSVQSDGYNVDFILPYLTAPHGYINQRPVASLLSDKALVPPNEIVTLIATTSSDDKRVVMYFFDFGDGKNSGWTTLSIFEHTYSSVGTYQASVKVMDDFGVISDNSAHLTMTVQALSSLDVLVSLSRSTMISTGQISVTARATFSGSPVQDASITWFSVPSGSFAAFSGLTNSTGYFTTTLTAPTVTEQINLRITARASKTGYADGADYEYLSVVPALSVQVTVDPTSIKSEATSNGTVHVTYSSAPVDGVTVKLSSDKGGSFSPDIGATDASGDLEFVFKAPQTLTQLDVTVTATATKSGYWDGSAQSELVVEPKTLVVQVTASPTTVDSKATSGVVVKVTYDGVPVANAVVTVSSDVGGTFTNTTGKTDQNGAFNVAFTAPDLTTLTDATITATANMAGYVNGQGTTKITVNPPPTAGPNQVLGLPLTTLLLIIIPIIAVVVVVVLLKKGIISFSRQEE